MGQVRNATRFAARDTQAEELFAAIREQNRLVDYRMFGLYAEMRQESQPPVPGPQVIPSPSAEENARNGALSCT
jgi:hypothetical protein